MTDQTTLTLERHELSEAFGDMQPHELEELRESLGELGLLDPIVMYEGKVLDGWHRYRLGVELGTALHFHELAGYISPKDFVISKNAARRSLTKSQMAIAIVKVREWRPHGITDEWLDDETDETATIDEMAREAGVHEQTIRDAKKAEAGGLGDAVKAGDLSASAAAQQVRDAEREPSPDDDDAPAEPPPRKPTPLERAEAEILRLRTALAEKTSECDDLQALQRAWDNASLDDESKANIDEINNLIAENRALQGAVGEHQQKARDLERSVRWLKSQVKDLKTKLDDCRADAGA